MHRLIPFLAVLLVQPAWADEEMPLRPKVPGNLESLGPGVEIIQRDQQSIEEYQAGNQVFMIKVTPDKGVPYYLVDTDGDGRLDTRRSDLEPDVVVPQWVLMRWK